MAIDGISLFPIFETKGGEKNLSFPSRFVNDMLGINVVSFEFRTVYVGCELLDLVVVYLWNT